MFDKEFPTEEILNDEQIINFIQHDENEKDDDDDDDDNDNDEVVPLISAKKPLIYWKIISIILNNKMAIILILTIYKFLRSIYV